MTPGPITSTELSPAQFARAQKLAITSLAFMLVDVPDPV